jgi:ATP-dependent helicase/nuclease subunit A
MREQRRLDFDSPDEPVDPLVARDQAARALATDPYRNVALEASAGTGKTRVLVDRYVRLVAEAEVPPRHILAMTFTRKAAAEMRQRVLATLKARHQEGALTGTRWRAIRDAFPDITIATIDAFCLSLLYEFPLEAGVDPGFELADETETPRLVNAALDRALRIGRSLATRDEDVALVFADLGELSLRRGLSSLLDRRLVAGPALSRFLRGRDLTIDEACTRLRSALDSALRSVPGGLRAFLDRGPSTPGFGLLAADLRALDPSVPVSPARLRGVLERLSAHVLTAEEEPRQRLSQKKSDFRSDADYDAHKAAVLALGPPVAEALAAFRRDLNVVMARGVQRLFAIAVTEYRRMLDRRGVLDFSDVLERTLALLERRDEFSRSRFKLESRYRHVLVDEFQDTSRAQWRLVRELMSSWAEGAGAGDDTLPPSIFIVGDRKQSIYGFRDADVAVLEEAARHIDALRPDRPARAAITRSYRAAAPLLRFVNDVFDAVEKQPDRPDAFRYSDDDRFPLGGVAGDGGELGIVAAASEAMQAEMVADEIARLLSEGALVRDRATGVRRAIGPGDIAILFRSREGHRLIELALSRRGVPSYVYKGLGFFDADEIRDILALLAYLADPSSSLRAAAFLRSRFVRISDAALTRVAADLPGALREDGPPLPPDLDAADLERLRLARHSVAAWQSWVDRLPPAELLDRVLAESAYPMELTGAGLSQARENVKKIRALVRRIQNRGYATVERLVEHFSQLVAGGDESNAIIDAVDAVNLMTVHASKGLEFPAVFIVNIGRGSGGGRDPVRVVASAEDDEGAEPAVGIGDHESDADKDAEVRDAEESKRLLYVALTRARDRLYLAGVNDASGRLAAARGSLARHLPESLVAVFADAATLPSVGWIGPASSHVLRAVARPGDEPVPWSAAPAPVVAAGHDVAPLAADGVSRTTVSRRRVDHGTAPGVALAADAGEAGSTAVLGTLVHALLARAYASDEREAGALRRQALRIVPEEVGAIDPAVVDRAVAIVGELLVHPDLVPPPGATVRFEVPYSRRLPDGGIERGAIDLLIVDERGVRVIELKTGRPGPAHSDQLGAYVDAVRAAYPDRAVEGQIVYVGGY